MMNDLKRRTMLVLSQARINLPQEWAGLLLNSESRPIADSFLEQSVMGITGQKRDSWREGLEKNY